MKKIIIVFCMMFSVCYGQAYFIYQEAEKYFNGTDGRPQSYEKSFKLYEKAAQEGCVLAEKKLGDCYASGYGCDSSKFIAFKWYKIAAKHGNVDAIYALGFYYFFGIGCKSNGDKAFELYRKAADNGHPLAIKALHEWGIYGYRCGYDMPELKELTGEEIDWYYYFLEGKIIIINTY